MANPVSICNLALSYIGDSASVASIDPPEGGPQAQMCATMYPMAVNALLEMYDWTFATRRASVAQYANEDSHGWKGVFTLPADCLRIVRVQSASEQHADEPTDKEYEVGASAKGRVLYTSADNPVVTYISSSTNSAYFSNAFVIALAWYLANMLAGQRVKGKEGHAMSQNCMKQFDVAIRLAKGFDASQQKIGLGVTPKWIKER